MSKRQNNQYLIDRDLFTTQEFADIVRETQAVYSSRSVFQKLEKLQSDGSVIKTGRGLYSKNTGRIPYRYESSPVLKEITALISDHYPLLEFQTWELIQWNEFINHQFAHNICFIEAENALMADVFELLYEKYPRVLFNPDAETYYRYHTDHMIVVQKLLSSTPVPHVLTKQTSLEKLLVDIFSKKLTGQLIERAEYIQIYETAFEKYIINETAMFRYAGRRHLDQKIRNFIISETDINLHNEMNK